MTADILELTGGTKKRVDEIIKGDKPSMLIMTASWCGHCNEMKPELYKFISKMRGDLKSRSKKGGHQKNAIIKIDDSNMHLLDDSVKNKINFEGYPHMVAVQNGGKINDFSGERNAENMENFFTTNVIGMQKGGYRARRTRSKRRSPSLRRRTLRKRRTPRRRSPRRRSPRRTPRRRTPPTRRRTPPTRRRFRYRRGRGTKKTTRRTRVRLGGNLNQRSAQRNKFRDLRRGTHLFPVI